MTKSETHPSVSSLHAWLEHRLSRGESRALESHLEQCGQCAQLMGELTQPDESSLTQMQLHPLDDSAGAALSQNAELTVYASHSGDTPASGGRDEQGDDSDEWDGTRAEQIVLSRPDATVVSKTVICGQKDDRRVLAKSDTPPKPKSAFGQRTSHPRWIKERLLARGGIGEVWVARDALFGRKVALKCLRSNFAHIDSLQRRFLHEARITATLGHPSIPYILDLHDGGANSFYVMPLVDGDTLSSHIRRYHRQRKQRHRHIVDETSFTRLMELLNHFVVVANTIALAHVRGVIHRDIKSENVVIGSYGQVTVLDWGIAKFIGDVDVDSNQVTAPQEEVRGHQTRQGLRLGTPMFMAPEQVAGDNSKLDRRTDVYALAGMLFEIITGRPPFQAKKTDDVYEAILTQTPPTFDSLGIDRQKALEAICQKGLSKSPDQRQQSATELAHDVQTWVASEAQRKERSARRERFFSLTSDLMAMVQKERGLLWANPTWKSVLGWDLEDLVGKNHFDLVHPDDLAELLPVLEELIKGGSYTIEPRMRCKDGSYKWILWTASRVPEEDFTYIIGRDVDQRHRREQQQTRLLDATPDALVVSDPDGTIHFVNRPAEELFGKKRESLVESNLKELIRESNDGTGVLLSEDAAECRVRIATTDLEMDDERLIARVIQRLE